MSADKVKNASGVVASTDRGQSVSRITVRVPGSSANLGPGFDTLALALTVYSTITFTVLPENDETVPLLTVTGADSKCLEIAISGFIFPILQEQIKLEPQLMKRLRLHVDSQIPIGRGLGSSAAMIIATLWASDRLLNRAPEQRSLLSRATAIEGHPDNVTASLLGGLVVAAVRDDQKTVLVHKLNWPEEWHLILLVPPYQVTTAKARSVLPKTVGRQDAVYNVQRTAILLAAIQSKNEELLQEALHDRIHEKYRAELTPELDALKKELRGSPALGCVLSGSGSSVLVVVNEREKNDLVKQIDNWRKQESVGSHILELRADQNGLQELHV